MIKYIKVVSRLETKRRMCYNNKNSWLFTFKFKYNLSYKILKLNKKNLKSNNISVILKVYFYVWF